MKSRRSKTPPFKKAATVNAPLYIGFSRFDELLASTTDPFPPGRFASRIEHARVSLAAVAGGACTVYSWAVLCSVANEMEAAIALGYVEDPTGLLADTFAALRACVGRFASASAMIDMPPEDVENLTDMVDGWADFQLTHSARRVVRAMRFTDARVLALARGELKMGDLVCTTTDAGSVQVESAADA